MFWMTAIMYKQVVGAAQLHFGKLHFGTPFSNSETV